MAADYYLQLDGGHLASRTAASTAVRVGTARNHRGGVLMLPRPGIRPLIFGAGVFVSGLAVGTVLAGWASAPTRAHVPKGATLVSFLPETVMSLTYASPGGMATMQRSVPGAPFQVLSTFADGRPAQHCSAWPDMEGRLDNLATLTARHSLSFEQREGEFPQQLGVIEVRDAMISEPSGLVLVFTNKPRTALAVILDGRAAEITLRPAELEWLATACSGQKEKAETP